MPMLIKFSGRGDGVPANQSGGARIPQLALLGVGCLLPYLILVVGG
jgi:hypothetical protein